jgi:hypothetical protein
VNIDTTDAASGTLGTMANSGPSEATNNEQNLGYRTFEGRNNSDYRNRYPIRWDRCAAPETYRREWWLHYKSDYQVFCPKAALPSPVYEYNTECCGARSDWERAHYDDTRQVCCNEGEGIPSSRDGYEKFGVNTDGTSLGDSLGVTPYLTVDLGNFTDLTATVYANGTDWNNTPQSFTTHTQPRGSKVQCCGKADYHTDYELCCDAGNNRPAPFVWTQPNADKHIEEYFLRTPVTRTTKVRGSYQEHGGEWSGRDVSNFAITDNEIELKARWTSIPRDFFPLRWDSCCAPVANKKDSHYFSARRAHNEWADGGSGATVTRGQVCCEGHNQLKGPSPPNQYNDACCGPEDNDFRRHYSHYNAYHQVCCHAAGMK